MRRFRESLHSKKKKWPFLLRGSVVGIIGYLISSKFDLYEHFTDWSQKNEAYEFDELSILLPIIFSWLIVELILMLNHYTDLSNSYLALSLTDSLTGIGNRRYFFQTTEQIIKSKYSKVDYEIYFFDVNGFKQVNDIYGHIIGDELLKLVSQYLKTVAPNDSILARIGGDEFVLFATTNSIIDPKAFHEKINADICSNLDKLNLENLDVSMSMGFAKYPHDGKTIDDLLHVADTRMYSMKNLLKNQ